MREDINKSNKKFKSGFSSTDTCGCVFCNIDENRIVSKNELVYCIKDDDPITKGHTLIIPTRHAKTYFDLVAAEVIAIFALILNQKKEIENLDKSVTGFNIGINCGEDAGQSVFHCHIHLIPRRKGDVDNPKGGIRNIIQE